jgi:hypothetical protein
MARAKTTSDSDKTKRLDDQAVSLATFAAEELLKADELDIKGKPVGNLKLKKYDREFLAQLPTLSAKFKKKLSDAKSAYTVAELASLTMMVAESLPDLKPLQQIQLLMIANSLTACLQTNIVMPQKPAKKKSKTVDALYQLKITLVDSEPAIWRRIQVKDCKLYKLHEYIQAAMGWRNSHLHHFRIGKQLYGDPMLLAESFEELNYEDTTTTLLSDILPSNTKRFRFHYEYDFGDSWDHEVLFEGYPIVEPGRKYPLCLEGERACPPEDVGGVHGYANFLDVIQDEDHEQHEEMLDWVGGPFDPELFNPANATKKLKKGM